MLLFRLKKKKNCYFLRKIPNERRIYRGFFNNKKAKLNFSPVKAKMANVTHV